MPATSVSRQSTVLFPRRLLAAAGDGRLVDQVRRGNPTAFEVIYDRYHRPLLGYCRHLVGSVHQAEDALQQTFFSAYRSLIETRRAVELRPWLYAIARNTCISHLRKRRQELTQVEVETVSSSDEAEQRADVREVVRDMAELPEEQRSALVLSELADLSHEEIAGVIGCERMKVKSLVHQARQRLSEQRRARETSCDEVREELSSLSGGSLRRTWLRLHLSRCPGCREHRREVRRQRALLALTIPVPSAGLKESILSATAGGGGVGGGGGAVLGGSGGTSGAAGGTSAAGGAAAAGGGAASGAAAAGTAGGGLLTSLGASAATKLVVGVALAGGAAVGGGLAAGGGDGPDRDVGSAAQTGHSEVAGSSEADVDPLPGPGSGASSTTPTDDTTTEEMSAPATTTGDAESEGYEDEAVGGEAAEDEAAEDGNAEDERSAPGRSSREPTGSSGAGLEPGRREGRTAKSKDRQAPEPEGDTATASAGGPKGGRGGRRSLEDDLEEGIDSATGGTPTSAPSRRLDKKLSPSP
jgi:RNA polymerase sigma factor (sigma-70 family)